MHDILDTLWQIVVLFGTLVLDLLLFIGTHALPIFWIAWSLLAVNWKKGWQVLRIGGWAPLVLLMFLVALVWSRLAPAEYVILDLFRVENFWWQLEVIAGVVAITLFCGWLQGVLRLSPAEINLEPPVPHDDGHGHAVAHGH